MKKAYYVWLFLLVFFLLQNNVTAQEEKKLIIVAIDSLTLNDLYFSQYNNLNHIINNASIGLMNTRTAGNSTREKAYVTLGADNRGSALTGSANGYNLYEKIYSTKTIDMFIRNTGLIPSYENIVNPEIKKIKDINFYSEYGAKAGYLGEKLKENGFKRAVIGNGDLLNENHREIFSVLMDKQGIVDLGRVDRSLLIKDPLFPTGYRSDFQMLLETTKIYLKQSDVVAVQISDLYRIEQESESLFETQKNKFKDQILTEIDDYLGKLINSEEFDNTALIILSPYPSNEAIKIGERLTPVIYFTNDTPRGLLYSSTTRRKGIIANIDIAPTILKYFNIDYSEATGSEILTLKNENNLNFIWNINKKATLNYNIRPIVIKAFILSEIVLLFIFIVFLLLHKSIKPFIPSALKIIVIALMNIPLVLILLPLTNYDNINSAVFYILILTASLTIIFYMITSRTTFVLNFNKIFFVCAATVVFLAIDIFTRGNLIKFSLLGYCPIIGARYYGLGNEYLGILLGSSIVSLSMIKRFTNFQVIPVITLAVLVLIIGHPELGANVGGMITAVLTFSLLAIKWICKKIRIVHVFVSGLMVFFVLFFAVIQDIWFSTAPTHLGSTIISLKQKGLLILFRIVHRKISMNLKLLNWTIWSQVLLTSVGVLAFVFYHPIGIMNKVINKHPFIKDVFLGTFTAVFIGMMVNDSGVVTAATSLIHPVMTLVYLVIDETFHVEIKKS
ncbi:MAG: hypothetical protein PWP21_1563 [Thermosediminibacterales bacterium]|nr:hypothetical protein [Thermosediminibacterales bacterium]